MGRSPCEDLVGCAAQWPTGQMGNANAHSIARQLARAYGIRVRCNFGGLPIAPEFNLMLG